MFPRLSSITALTHLPSPTSRLAQVALHRETGQSRGYAFVSFRTVEQANAAIAALHGLNVEGRALRVSSASVRGGGHSQSATLVAPLHRRAGAWGSGVMFNGRMAAGPRVHGLGVLARGKFEGSRVVS